MSQTWKAITQQLKKKHTHNKTEKMILLFCGILSPVTSIYFYMFYKHGTLM